MTTIAAEIVADSISAEGVRLTTLQLRYPRWIHSELMTHRVFSRNASSSRAVPVHRLIDDIERDPAVPLFWGRNQPGMQAAAELNGDDRDRAGDAWHCALQAALTWAREIASAGAHKQIVNRVLEPFSHINVVVTATEWSNFFTLRRHDDAEPHIRVLADRMFEAMTASVPKLLLPGDWHLPYVTDWTQPVGAPIDAPVRASVARCARVSYLTHDGRVPDIVDDLALYDRLVASAPLHASPAEHQATPDRMRWSGWETPALHGNLRGWIQFRKTLRGENADTGAPRLARDAR